jgi:hypothetical protein
MGDLFMTIWTGMYNLLLQYIIINGLSDESPMYRGTLKKMNIAWVIHSWQPLDWQM